MGVVFWTPHLTVMSYRFVFWHLKLAHSYNYNRVYCAHVELYIFTSLADSMAAFSVHYKYLAVLQGIKYLTQQ